MEDFMSIDINMKQVLKFNRSYMTKNHYTKSDLEQIALIYQICKQSHKEPQSKDLYNTRFAMIAEEAVSLIKSFSAGKISVSADALDLMQDFIEEFGREYVRHSQELRYEYTQDARCAKLMIQKLRHNLEQKDNQADVEPNNKPSTQVIVHPATAKIRQSQKQGTSKPKSGLVSRLMQSLRLKKRSKSKASSNIHTKSSNKKSPSAKVFKLQPELRKKFAIGFKNSLRATVIDMKKEVGAKVRRYGIAAVALWGMSGTAGVSNADAHVEHRDIKQTIERDLTRFEFPDETAAAIAEMNGNSDTLDLTSAFAENIAMSNFKNFQSSLDLSLPWMYNDSIEDAEETAPKTIADISYADYYFSGEELAAMGESKIGAELTENAVKVARNMNCEGYCYRGVKRMFRRSNLGNMEGRSAYMAKSYMDVNSNFKQIRCDFDDLDKLPNGSVVIFDRGRNSHVHGHIFVVGRDKEGRAKDFSSKIRNVRSTLKGYGGYYVYVPADTPIPETVQEKIESIMVLNHPNEEYKGENSLWQMPLNIFGNSGRTAI